MEKDKFSATWVSHSSIGDFLKCPRAYYLNNVYKSQVSGHKITLMSPPLALGQAVHEVVESLSVLPVKERFKEPLSSKLEKAWQKVEGKKGGFGSEPAEKRYKDRALTMLKKVLDDPGPLNNLAVKINMDLPHYWLSEEDEIILCGKIDWLEYLPDVDGVHIIDFKTGKYREEKDSLQLPIYYLLVENCQKRPVKQASYWYLAKDDGLEEKPLPDLKEAEARVLKVAKEVKLARKLERYGCPKGGCRACLPLEKIVKGEAEFVGVNDFNQDVYIYVDEGDEGPDSVIL